MDIPRVDAPTGQVARILQVVASPLALVLVAGGYATSDERRGSAGPVRWEILWDVPSRLGEPRIALPSSRAYTVVLTERAGRRIELDYVESRAEGHRVLVDETATVRSTRARRYLGETLEPEGEHRISFELPVERLPARPS
jgi:hypothetical protein